ncbi:unannotated protein [freshwater metagenome]|uniref:Unannotated protein n=1 Tax=freshwater metagenome TaxID=449393 RepID=A0A6J6RQ81_9ZZZZ
MGYTLIGPARIESKKRVMAPVVCEPLNDSPLPTRCASPVQ